jgi:2'-5' RNA ligase
MVVMAGPNLRSALLVEVPEAEPLVGQWRMDLDPHAALGVPAHITVLFPFAPPPLISTTILDRLGELLTAVDAFSYNLIETGWFGDSVLWLAPDPPDPFRSLTRRIGDAFTDYPPYGGRFGEPVPHLTIADGGLPEQMKAAETAVQAGLPISATAASVSLLHELVTGRWQRAASFPLRRTTSDAQQHRGR